MNIEKLLKLESDLLGIGPDDPVQLDMWQWGVIQEGCLTAACALGRSALLFPQELTFESVRQITSDKRHPHAGGIAQRVRHLKTGSEGFQAGMHCFGLTFDESRYIFDQGTYLSEEEKKIKRGPNGEVLFTPVPAERVAERIRYLLNGGKVYLGPCCIMNENGDLEIHS